MNFLLHVFPSPSSHLSPVSGPRDVSGHYAVSDHVRALLWPLGGARSCAAVAVVVVMLLHIK